MLEAIVTFLNVPNYAKNHKFIVARPDYSDPSKFWFFGAWDDEETAKTAAINENGFVFKVGEAE